MLMCTRLVYTKREIIIKKKHCATDLDLPNYFVHKKDEMLYLMPIIWTIMLW